jgi:hypothetical protein
MEKLVYVSYEPGAHDLRAHLDQLDLPRAVESAALYLLDPPVNGEGPSAVLTAWLSCVDRRGPLERFLARGRAKFHGYVASETTVAKRALPDSTRATLEIMEMPENVSNVNVWLDTLELSRDGMRDGVQFARNLLVRALSPEAPHLVLVREGVGTQARDVERSTGDRSSWLPAARTTTIPPPVGTFSSRSTTIPPPPAGERASWLPGRAATPPEGMSFGERSTVPSGRVSTLPPIGGSRSSMPPSLGERSSIPMVERSSIPPRISTLPVSGERTSQVPMPRISTLPPGSERPSQVPQRPSQLGLYANANTFTGERITLRRGQL